MVRSEPKVTNADLSARLKALRDAIAYHANRYPHDLADRIDRELGEDIGVVALRRPDTHVEVVRHLLVALPQGQQAHDFEFPRGEKELGRNIFGRFNFLH